PDRATARSPVTQASAGVAARRRQLGDRPADDPRDLHLGDADDLADLLLREVLLEAQPQHAALALVEALEQARDRRAVLGPGQLGVQRAVRVGQRGVLVVAAARGVQRRGAHALLGLERLEHLLVVELQRLADLADRRGAP